MNREGNAIGEHFVSEEVKIYLGYAEDEKKFITGAIDQEKCFLQARFTINKTPGKFFLTMLYNHYYTHLETLRPDVHKLINFQHTISQIVFGYALTNEAILSRYIYIYIY